MVSTRKARLRGDVGSTAVSESSSMNKGFWEGRALSGLDIDPVAASPGTCQIRTSLDTLYTGDVVAFGAVFTVTSLTEDIQIQSFEFANIESNGDHNVTIYAKRGTTFSSDANDWEQLSTTQSVKSPDGLGAIAPRADMEKDIELRRGDEWMFYFALDSGHLKMGESTEDVGSFLQSDEYLQLNVGESLGPGPEFLGKRTPNHTFQGKIHYSVLTQCSQLAASTELSFPFAASPDTNRRVLNTAVTDGFERLLTDEADLARWKDVYGLSITGVDLKSKGAVEDCSTYGFSGGCELYDSALQLGHFQSLDARELRLEFMLKLNNRNGLGDLEDELSVVYIGDEVFQLKYDIQLSGVPQDTILNPFQREYLEDVTLNFLSEFSDADPLRVEMSQVVDSRRNLRRDISAESPPSSAITGRDLQSGGFLIAEAIVFGIGSNVDEFVDALELAFVDNTAQYKEEVQKRQYLPSQVNDGEDFGVVFSEVSGIAVKRKGSFGTISSVGENNNPAWDKEKIQLVVFSGTIALSALWLLYRFLRDFIFVQGKFEVNQTKLSDKLDEKKPEEKEKSGNSELDNMDKPRQKISGDAAKAIKVSDLKLPSDEKDNSRRGRKEPSSRGVSRTKSSGDAEISKPKSVGDLQNRGVSTNKSSDLAGLGGSRRRSLSRSKSSGAGEMSRTDSDDLQMMQKFLENKKREPRRGVKKSRSSDDPISASTRSERRTVSRSRSDDDAMSMSARTEGRRGSRARRNDNGSVRSRRTLDPGETRGVVRSKSTEEGSMRSRRSRGESDSVRSRRTLEPGETRGVVRSKSIDDFDSPKSSRTSMTAPPRSRGVKKSNTFSGHESFKQNGNTSPSKSPRRASRANAPPSIPVRAASVVEKENTGQPGTPKAKKRTSSMPPESPMSTATSKKKPSSSKTEGSKKKKTKGKKKKKPARSKSEPLDRLTASTRPPRPTRVSMAGPES